MQSPLLFFKHADSSRNRFKFVTRRALKTKETTKTNSLLSIFHSTSGPWQVVKVIKRTLEANSFIKLLSPPCSSLLSTIMLSKITLFFILVSQTKTSNTVDKGALEDSGKTRIWFFFSITEKHMVSNFLLSYAYENQPKHNDLGSWFVVLGRVKTERATSLL